MAKVTGTGRIVTPLWAAVLGGLVYIGLFGCIAFVAYCAVTPP